MQYLQLMQSLDPWPLGNWQPIPHCSSPLHMPTTSTHIPHQNTLPDMTCTHSSSNNQRCHPITLTLISLAYFGPGLFLHMRSP